MPASPFRIELADGVVRVEVRAPYTLDEFRAAIDEIAELMATEQRRRLLWINHQARVGITAAQVRAIVGAVEWKLKTDDLAIALVSSAEMVYGLHRVFLAYAEIFRMQVELFADEGEARAWLG